jgi:uncharacterized membrane protein YraQ (UPF0718 family)
MPETYYHIRDLLEGTYTLRILEGAFDLLLTIGPYLAVSIIIGVAATRYFRVNKPVFSSRSELLSILSATVIGVVSPLPTYAAIPVGLSLMPAGVPFSAVLAFAISSPLMNPSIFFLTATQLGVEIAVVRTVAAFILGSTGGVAVMYVFKFLPRPALVGTAVQNTAVPGLAADFWKNTRYTVKVFSVSILLSAAVKALVPPQAIVDLLGEHARMGTLIAIALGVPFYSCGGAAIPFVQTLMEMGMSKGAMLAFFIAGPATKLETLYAFKSLLGGKVLLYYLLLTLFFSCLAGAVYSLF